MATLEEVTQTVSDLTTVITAIDSKLDEVRDYINSIPAGTVITQEQLDALAASLEAVKQSAQSVLAEADSMDGSEPA